MNKSTLFFAGLSVVLVAALTFTIWQLVTIKSDQLGSSKVAFGLPGLGGSSNDNDFQVKSALLYDTDTKQISYEQNGFERRPIASITKLMTAMVALDIGIDWEAEANILPEEYYYGGKLVLHPSETVTMRDLFMASLMSSANNATQAIVRQIGIPEDEFIRRMNTKAIELNLEQTVFVEGTGLDPDNISTAYEVARLAQAAFAYPEIASATSQHLYSFTVKGSGREHTLKNVNKNFSEENPKPFSGSKTGYLYEAGYCLVVQGTGDQQNKIAVILGSLSEPGHFQDINRLINL